MIKLNKCWIFYLLFVTTLSGCDDIFEEDISNNIITKVSPQDNDVVESNVVRFLWDELEGASNYRLQIYGNVNEIIEDTLTDLNQYILPLETGNYSWRVRGENFAYNTPYTPTTTFRLINSNDLTDQLILLTNPDDNYYSKSEDILLQWQNNESAENYTLEVVEIDTNNSSTTILFEEMLTQTSFELGSDLITADAVYVWRVMGVNNFSQSSYSERKIFIDNIAPARVDLLAPEINAIAQNSTTVLFSWQIPNDIGEVQSNINSILEISRTNDFSEIIYLNETEIDNDSVIFSDLGNYFWRIKLIDEAGNTGEYSEVRTFMIE